MNPVVETRELTRRFGSITAVDRVSLQIPAGSVFALIGSNCAGKSTLIRMLTNLLEPSAGQASVLGGDRRTLTGDGSRRIGYVAEDQEQPDWMTVGQLLDYCRRIRRKKLSSQSTNGTGEIRAATVISGWGRDRCRGRGCGRG